LQACDKLLMRQGEPRIETNRSAGGFHCLRNPAHPAQGGRQHGMPRGAARIEPSRPAQCVDGTASAAAREQVGAEVEPALGEVRRCGKRIAITEFRFICPAGELENHSQIDSRFGVPRVEAQNLPEGRLRAFELAGIQLGKAERKPRGGIAVHHRINCGRSG